MIFYRFFFLLFFSVLQFNLNSQEPYYRTLSTEDGLPSNTVHTVFTDSKGFIWFGTPNGAVRWDSKNFKTYTIEDGLPNNEVLGFFEDNRGRLWISTFSNELCYLKDKVVYTKRNDKRLEHFNPNFCTSVFEFNSHLFINGTKNNIVIDLTNLNFLSNIDSDLNLYSFSKYQNQLIGYCWSKVDTLIYTIFKHKDSFYYGKRYTESNLTKINSKFFNSIFFNKTISTNFPTTNKFCQLFFIDSIINFKQKSIVTKNLNYNIFQLNSNIFIAKKELEIYNSTNSILKLNSRNISKLISFNDHINYLSDRQIFTLNEKKIFYINPSYNTIYNTNVVNPNQNIITTSYGIFNLNSSNLITKKTIPKTISNFKHINFLSKFNAFIISTSKDISILNHNKFKILKNQRTYCSFFDNDNRLWFSGLDKIYFQDNFIDTFSNIKEFILDKRNKVFVKDMLEDSNGNIYFTTNKGVYIYDKKNNLKYNISKTDLLTSNETNKLVLDIGNNSFWVATSHGINHIRYSYKNNKLRFELINRFLKDDGLPSNEINDIVIKGDSVYVATPKGLCMIANKNYRPDTISIPIYINNFKVNDSLIHYDSSIYLMPNHNNLELDYSAIYYLRRDRLAVRYKLIRNGDTTIYDITDTKLRLNALNSGEYQLIITAYDIDYPYINGESKIYKFTIEKPFYQTWWFYLLGLLVIGFLSYMYYKRKLNRIQQINLYEKKFSQLKLEALKAEMNPHFIFNCLTAIKDYIMKADIEKSQFYLTKLAKLIRLALYNSKDEFVKLSDEINFIDIYIELERMRFDNKFDFIKDIDSDNFNHIQIPTMILQPFFENAIRHGKIGQLDMQGKLFFRVSLLDNNLVFDIRDNGIGIDAANQAKESMGNEHRSMALEIINERIAIYNQSYQIDIRYTINTLVDNEYKTQVLVYLNLQNL